MKNTILAFVAVVLAGTSAFAQGDFKFKSETERQWEEEVARQKQQKYQEELKSEEIEVYGSDVQYTLADFTYKDGQIIKAIVLDEENVEVCTVANIETKASDEGHVVLEEKCGEFILSIYIDSHGLFDDEYVFKLYEEGSDTNYAYAQIFEDDGLYIGPSLAEKMEQGNLNYLKRKSTATFPTGIKF